MKKIKKLLLIIIILFSIVYALAYFNVGILTIYRTREFVPKETALFNGWEIEARVYAYKGSWGADYKNDHDFYVTAYALQRDDSAYKPVLKSIKLVSSAGDDIPIKEFKFGGQSDEREFYLSSKDEVYIAPKVGRITMDVEVEFKQNGKPVLKRFTIHLRRNESQMVFLKMV